MQSSTLVKLENLVMRHQELAELLSLPEIVTNQNKFRDYSKEYADLLPIVEAYQNYVKASDDLETANIMLQEDDAELKEMAKEEIQSAKEIISDTEKKLSLLLLPKDPNDECNIFLEIRAGTGGDEAAIFSGDLFRMYYKYAENKNWKIEVISESEGEHGGYKEIILRIIGEKVYSHLKFESGAHRVQRVPLTESQGRVHTSACTVAVMPEVEIISEVDLDPKDLRIDTYRASGAGGQHVNRTDSAVRITHIPTNTVAECQDERSQHKNKAKAMSLLATKILTEQKNKQLSEQAQTRRNLVGTGDRSDRIRTYNYPQGRVTDHRINLTLYKLPEIMEGDLQSVISPLLQEHQADLLSQVNDEN